MAHATGIAVFFWLAGMSARLIFAFSAGHGGAEMIARFRGNDKIQEFYNAKRN
ncbi:hypothetical protein Dxin01_04336 [Deinococcus xinjiangensis]|uniref:Uncharacterized protein n=1 Tax=Deinococcus xinjiangensis TaxID=457454 RepID=A0ABP9VKA5_9DEIO